MSRSSKLCNGELPLSMYVCMYVCMYVRGGAGISKVVRPLRSLVHVHGGGGGGGGSTTGNVRQ